MLTVRSRVVRSRSPSQLPQPVCNLAALALSHLLCVGEHHGSLKDHSTREEQAEQARHGLISLQLEQVLALSRLFRELHAN